MYAIDTSPTHYSVYQYIGNMKLTIIDLQGCNIVPALVRKGLVKLY